MNKTKATKSPFLFGLLAIFSLLLFSFYLEYVEGVIPCPLCELQRLTFVLIGIWFFMGIVLYKIRFIRIILYICLLTTALFGSMLASKQIWLQHFPEATGTACGASLTYLVKMFSWHAAIKQIFSGSAECTIRGWDFLSLNLAEWALILFISIFILSGTYLIKEWRKKQ